MATKAKAVQAPPAPTPPTPQRGEKEGAGLPVEVQAAVEELKQEPDSVLEFKVYPNKVVLILLDYRKYTFSLGELVGRIRKLRG